MPHQSKSTQFGAGSDRSQLYRLVRTLLHDPDGKRIPLSEEPPTICHLHDSCVPNSDICQQLFESHSLQRIHKKIHADSRPVGLDCARK